MKRKAQLFTLDLLIALIPLTIIIGVSANVVSGIATQQQQYSYYYAMQRIADDALDVLIKNTEKGLGMKAYFNKGAKIGTITIDSETIGYYLNLTEWWKPFKESVISSIAGEIKTDVLDIEGISMHLNNTPILVNFTNVYLINSSFISSLTGDYGFRFGIIPFNHKNNELNLENMEKWGFFTQGFYDSNSDGLINEDESIKILPYSEHGSLKEDIVSIRRPVLFVFYENIALVRNSTTLVIPMEIDSFGYASSIVFMLRPERVNITNEKVSGYNITERGYIPLTLQRVYINASPEINGTLVFYVNGAEIYSGSSKAEITEEITPYLTKDVIGMQLRVYNSKPDSLGYLNLTIACSEPWVFEVVCMKPSYAVVEVGR